MAAGTRPRVLCVDDNRDAADSTAELFRVVGFDARASYDGPSALEEARDFLPDVCLLDLNMPGMDGDELAVQLRERAGGRPVLFIALTAMSGEADRCRTRSAGCVFHLVKPVDPHDLLKVVDEMWQTYSAAEPTSSSLVEKR